MKKYIVVVAIVLSLILLLFSILAVTNMMVVSSASGSEIISCDDVKIPKKYDAIVVLGAGVRPDGTPSHMLEDRLRGAVALYNSGAADVIIISGDNSGEDYDEVSAMEKYCLEAGVPSDALIRDDIGFSTYETMYNVINAMGYENIIVVTQQYHLYRALYIAKRMGAVADGFAADYRTYSGQIKRDIREIFARTKDLVKTNISFQ